jgi:hypothetical protein
VDLGDRNTQSLVATLSCRPELSLAEANKEPSLLYNHRTFAFLRLAYAPNPGEIIDAKKCTAPAVNLSAIPGPLRPAYGATNVTAFVSSAIADHRTSGAPQVWVDVPLATTPQASVASPLLRMLFVPDHNGGDEGWLVTRERWEGLLRVGRPSALLLGSDLAAALALHPHLSLAAYNEAPTIAQENATRIVLRTAVAPAPGAVVDTTACTQPFVARGSFVNVPAHLDCLFAVANASHIFLRSVSALRKSKVPPIQVLVPLSFKDAPSAVSHASAATTPHSELLFVPDSGGGSGWLVPRALLDAVGQVQRARTIASNEPLQAQSPTQPASRSKVEEEVDSALPTAASAASPAAVNPANVTSSAEADQYLAAAKARRDRVSRQRDSMYLEQQRLADELQRLSGILSRVDSDAAALDSEIRLLQARRDALFAEEERAKLEAEVEAARASHAAAAAKLQEAEAALARAAASTATTHVALQPPHLAPLVVSDMRSPAAAVVAAAAAPAPPSLQSPCPATASTSAAAALTLPPPPLLPLQEPPSAAAASASIIAGDDVPQPAATGPDVGRLHAASSCITDRGGGAVGQPGGRSAYYYEEEEGGQERAEMNV